MSDIAEKIEWLDHDYRRRLQDFVLTTDLFDQTEAFEVREKRPFCSTHRDLECPSCREVSIERFHGMRKIVGDSSGLSSSAPYNEYGVEDILFVQLAIMVVVVELVDDAVPQTLELGSLEIAPEQYPAQVIQHRTERGYLKVVDLVAAPDLVNVVGFGVGRHLGADS